MNRRARGNNFNRGHNNGPMNFQPHTMQNVNIWENRGVNLSLEEQQYLAQQAISVADLLDPKRTREYLDKMGLGPNSMPQQFSNNLPMDIGQRQLDRGFSDLPEKFNYPSAQQYHHSQQMRNPDNNDFTFRDSRPMMDQNSDTGMKPLTLSDFSIEEIQQEVVRRINKTGDQDNGGNFLDNGNRDRWDTNVGGKRPRSPDSDYLRRLQAEDRLRQMEGERSGNPYVYRRPVDMRREMSPNRLDQDMGFRNEMRGNDLGMDRHDDRMKSDYATKDIQWDISREMLNDQGIPDRNEDRRPLERDSEYPRERMQWNMREQSIPSYPDRRQDEDQGPMRNDSGRNVKDIHWDMPREPSPRSHMWEGRRFDNEYPEIRQVRSEDEPAFKRRFTEDEFEQRREEEMRGRHEGNYQNEAQWDMPREMHRDAPRDIQEIRDSNRHDTPRELYRDEPIFYRRERREEGWNNSGNADERMQDLRMRLDSNTGNRRGMSDRLGPIVHNDLPSLLDSENEDLGSHFSSLEQDKWGNMQFTVPNSIRIQPRHNQTMRDRLKELEDIKAIMKETLEQYNSDPSNRPNMPRRKPSPSLIAVMSDINSTVIPQYISEKGGRLSNDELYALKYAAAITALKYNAIKNANSKQATPLPTQRYPRWQSRLHRNITDLRTKIGRISQLLNTGKMGARLEANLLPIFKQLNITATHEKRDEVLREHLEILRETLRTKTERMKLYTSANPTDDAKSDQKSNV